jgi:hypothetical protein
LIYKKTSLQPGRLAVEEISSFLRLTPCGIFQSPSSTGTFPLRCNSPIQKARWLNQEGIKVKTSARARRLRKKKAGRSSWTTGKPHAFSAAGEEKGAAGTPKNNTEL